MKKIQKKRKNRSAGICIPSLCIKLALATLLPTIIYLILADWSYAWTYHEIKEQNFQTVDSRCVSIAQDRNDEPFGGRNGGMRTIYNFTLENGIVVGIYADTAEQALSIHRMEELEFLTGRDLTFTYLTEACFSNGTYVLLSISEDGKVLLRETEVFATYRGRLTTAAWLLVIACAIALLFVLVPLVVNLLKNQKKSHKKKQKKQKKQQQAAKKSESPNT